MLCYCIRHERFLLFFPIILMISMRRSVGCFQTAVTFRSSTARRPSSVAVATAAPKQQQRGTTTTFLPSTTNSEDDLVQSLLSTALNRAQRTFATTQQQQHQSEETVPLHDHDAGATPSPAGDHQTATATAKQYNTSTPPSLIASVIERAQSTLSVRHTVDSPSSSSSTSTIIRPDEHVTTGTSCASNVDAVPDSLWNEKAAHPQQDESTTNDETPTAATSSAAAMLDIQYGQNPTITSTALAHLLWKSVLRPGVDSAIDATAGNGSDTVALAKLLFPSSSTTTTTSSNPSQSHLLAVDVQEVACQKTLRRLSKVSVPLGRVQVVCASHAPLPLPPDTSSVALVVYNLGYLPNHSQRTQTTLTTTTSTTTTEPGPVTTQTKTTLASLADAALVLRVGGVLSVTTYPRTNAEEDVVVRAFMEGLALFSSQTMSYETHLQNLCSSHQINETWSEQLRVTLQHVWEKSSSDSQQQHPTWRVHEHRKLGWVDAPILLTATRIK